MKSQRRLLYTLLVIVVLAMVATIVKRSVTPRDPLPDPKPRTTIEVNGYHTKYAGGYTVEVVGYTGTDIESFILRKDATATWMMIVPDATKGARTESKKYGTWTAAENKVVISIKGNTGTIIEEFNYRNDKFRSTISAGRYL